MEQKIEFRPGQDALWRLPQVLATVGVSKSCWWDWVAQGQAPQPVRVGARITLWRASSVYDFVEQLANEGLPQKQEGNE